MGFYRDKKDTNIDLKFDKNNSIFNLLSKYKIIILIVIIILLVLGLILLFSNNKVSKENIINYLELVGDDEISLYQGSDYIEFGYKAYNSKNEDLTKQVKVQSDINTNVIGEYEIIYTLGDISKIRKVIVVEKPEEYTYIYLNSINNNINLVLKVGDEYIEPGYKAFSSSGKNINSEVQITGTVDTSKAGTYTIVYSVRDSYGYMVSVQRIIRVIDIELVYSLNTDKYTKNDVEINLKVYTDKFSYILLPNGDKVNKSEYIYKVSNNGKYQFEVFNEYGFSKKVTIEVNNIDKVSPTGTCKVTHNSNGSIINISASDNSGISKYVYNGKEYTSNSIILNEYIKESPLVVFYDGVGNSGSATCTVTDIPDEYFVDTSHYSYNNGIKTPDITYVDVTDLSCTIVNGYFKTVSKIPVHKEIANNFHGILELVCNYVNKTPWLENLQHNGAYVNREVNENDYHAKGVAIDLNDEWTYISNGKTYKPYSWQGLSTWEDYNEFICEVCDGNEDCPYNVNYIIFKRYFEGNGWCWGGNYSPDWFDPMHFELRDYGKCAVSNKKQISC